MLTGNITASSIGCGISEDRWQDVCSTFKREFGDSIYGAWISHLSLVSLGESEIVLSVPTNFLRDWIKREYMDGQYKVVRGKKVFLRRGIRQILLDFFPKLVSFEILVDRSSSGSKSENNVAAATTAAAEKGDSIAPAAIANTLSMSEYGNLYNIGTELHSDYNFDNFVVGQSNRLAFEVAKNFANGGEDILNINPLFIYGNVGLGKTHLCQSIAWAMKVRYPEKTIVYLSAERFMFLFVQALQGQNINDFKNRFRHVDVLLVDDIQFITGKDRTQKEFFYTFDALVNDGKRVVMACDRAPANLENLDEKLKSRMNGGLIVNIEDPDYQLRRDLVIKKSRDFGLLLTAETEEFLAQNLQISCREIEGCLRRLAINQRIMGVNLDREYIAALLADSMPQKTLTIRDIQERVAEFFELSWEDMKSTRRLKNLVLPRHVAMYLCRKMLNSSFPTIASKFSTRSHATVISGVAKVKKKMEEDSKFCALLTELENSLK